MIPLAEVLARWLDSDSVSENRAADEVRERAAEVEALFAPALTKARRETLTEAADAWSHGEWGNTPRHADQVADRIGAAQYVGDWLRARAEAQKT